MVAYGKIVIVLLVLMLSGLASAGRALGDCNHHKHHRHHHGSCSPQPGGHKACQVGGSLGWTSEGKPDYHGWSSNHTFHVGDTIVFKYPKGHDNVLMVDLHAYHTCNSSSPLATFESGDDSITFKKKGHYYFISGIKDHCSHHHQKIDIKVPKEPQHSAAAAPVRGRGLLAAFTAVGALYLAAVY